MLVSVLGTSPPRVAQGSSYFTARADGRLLLVVQVAVRLPVAPDRAVSVVHVFARSKISNGASDMRARVPARVHTAGWMTVCGWLGRHVYW